MRKLNAGLVIIALLAIAGRVYSSDMSAEDMAEAASSYSQYCALCHGPDREGHVNDHAPT